MTTLTPPLTAKATPRRSLWGRWGVQSAAWTYVTVMLLIPLAVIFQDGLRGGLGTLWHSISLPIAWSALRLTLWTSALMAIINAVMGTLTAYTLVRYEFPGKSLLNAIVDLPLAIPTLVTGVMLVVLYGCYWVIRAVVLAMGLWTCFRPAASTEDALVADLESAVEDGDPIAELFGLAHNVRGEQDALAGVAQFGHRPVHPHGGGHREVGQLSRRDIVDVKIRVLFRPFLQGLVEAHHAIAEQRQELVQNLEEGQVIDGVVKNITDYGAFVDLGGIDGLLHVTDIAWRRVNHPTEVLNIGQSVKVKIIKINHETHRISLGMKQLQDDPWQGIEAKYPVGARYKGRVTNITDYGAFVELEPGIEGLIHVSEMSWTKKNVHPGKIVSTSQEVEVQILEVDPVKRRISLGLKQTMRNPWEVFVEKHPPGSTVEGEVKNKTEFGLFLGLDGDVDGMVHLSDLDWKRPGEQVIEEYKKGDMVKAQVLDVDVEKERISLGIKQLEGDPFADAGDVVKKGAVITCEVTDAATLRRVAGPGA